MIKEIKEYIKNTLQAEMNEKLPLNLRIAVEIPGSVSNYVLTHPIGAYLILYEGSEFVKRELVNYIAQDRNMKIQVYIICRHRNEMTPEEYIDFAINSLTGAEISVNKNDNKIYCLKDEFIGEENGVWTYVATFIVPEEFFESKIN
jgi:hypothetical protein